MLTLSSSAAQVVNTMTEVHDMAETAGLRIANGNGQPGPENLQAEFVAAPGEQDQVLTQDGARVFLDANAASYLSDKVLTAELDKEGHAQFGLSPIEEPGAPVTG